MSARFRCSVVTDGTGMPGVLDSVTSRVDPFVTWRVAGLTADQLNSGETSPDVLGWLEGASDE